MICAITESSAAPSWDRCTSNSLDMAEISSPSSSLTCAPSPPLSPPSSEVESTWSTLLSSSAAAFCINLLVPPPCWKLLPLWPFGFQQEARSCNRMPSFTWKIIGVIIVRMMVVTVSMMMMIIIIDNDATKAPDDGVWNLFETLFLIYASHLH